MTTQTDQLTFAMATAPRRNSKTWKMESVTWGELLDWAAHPADRKECGSYVLGTLSGTRRTNQTLVSRGALTLDVDHPAEGFLDDLRMSLGNRLALVHTTFQSTKAEPRYRVIIPLDREVAPDEYRAAAHYVMHGVDYESFDHSSVEPARYMFRPATAKPSEYHWEVIGNRVAQADALLVEFEHDLSELDTPKPSRFKRDPFEIDGPVGAFNRAYQDWAELIDVFELPYEPAEGDRWHLKGAAAAAGMSQCAPGLVYSHHSNDPAYGKACSAFDLVRLHVFGHLDEDSPSKTPVNRLPSHKAMLELATTDARVVTELVGSDFKDELDDAADEIDSQNWITRFRLNPNTGKVEDDIQNWDLIAAHDPALKGLYFNELSMAVETAGELPWRKLTAGREVFDAGDRASLALHIERSYGIRPSRAYLDDLISDKARTTRRNPVREYLESLTWDGKPRLETCLPGTRDTKYTALVARKALVSAVARMMEPGCKADHMLVLYGPEGLGKSFWIDKMSRGFSSPLGRIGDKDTLITMQRSWIMTSDEGHAMKNAEWDAQKEFITRRSDVFRAPYEREAQVHQRHCVIWGTTNDEVFLRRQEGNRRFLMIRCEESVDFDALTPEYINQVWAEAMTLYQNGEKLYLTDEESELAAYEREAFMEEDVTVGMVQEYLDTLVPADWESRSPESRQQWLMTRDDGISEKGTERITVVCSNQLWVEAMGRRRGEHKRLDLLNLTTAMKNNPGWVQLPGRVRVPFYGPQVVFQRVDAENQDDLESLDDLI